MEKCNDHSGCIERIKYLEGQDREQWEKMSKMEEKTEARFNSMFTRINAILGGIVVACILLVINLFTKL